MLSVTHPDCQDIVTAAIQVGFLTQGEGIRNAWGAFQAVCDNGHLIAGKVSYRIEAGP